MAPKVSVSGLIPALIIAASLTGAASGIAQAQQKFPTKPVRIVVGFSAGSATDITARMVATKLGDIWGQSLVIENRTGAAGQLATVMVANAAPDGHTLLMISTAMVINSVLPDKPLYNLLKDFTGVTQIGTVTTAVVVTPSLGVKSVKELIALAHERSGKLLYGTSGAGSGTHITTARFNMAAGIKGVHVAFKGLPEVLIEVAAGRLNYGLISLGPALPFIQEKRVIALAQIAAKRAASLPDVPLITEALPGFERDTTHAIIAPAGTPSAIVNQISRDIARALEFPDVRERMANIGFEPAPLTPEEHNQQLRRLHESLSKVVVAVGLRAP